MDTREILSRVQSGEISVDDALKHLKTQTFEDLGYAMIDHHRAVRQGAGEVVYGAGKTAEQIAGICAHLAAAGAENILITRMSPDKAEYVRKAVPLDYDSMSQVGVAAPKKIERVGNIAIATGGTSDMPVAEEAARTAEALGSRVTRLYDVGVAGLHRLLSHLDLLEGARVVIAIAGMEGALASVVGGLVSCPVIAVPTSVGYGASFHGVAALLSMLNSCASGVSVVNIDNGFGAGFLAHRINTMPGL